MPAVGSDSPSPPGPSEAKESEYGANIPPESSLREHLQAVEAASSKSSWTVPIEPDAALPTLVRCCTVLARNGLDESSEACRLFYTTSLKICYNRVLLDQAVPTWAREVFDFIYLACRDLMELFIVKFDDECPAIWDVMSNMFSSLSKFHIVTISQHAEPVGDAVAFARPGQRGYLVNLMNHFGALQGFAMLKARLSKDNTKLTITWLANYLKIVASCSSRANQHCTAEYISPMVEFAIEFLQDLPVDDMRKACRTDASADCLNTSIRALRGTCYRMDEYRKAKIPILLKIQLRVYATILEEAPFNSKMIALRDIIRACNIPDYQRPIDEQNWWTSENLLEWILEADVLSIVLRDNLHQSQYVERVERLIQFLIQEKGLTKAHLDALWESQIGKHEAIVKNVHGLLARLAWLFGPDQLDHLFSCFEAASSNASKKSQENLLRLISHLAEDDKDGKMSSKVLTVQWRLAFDEKTPPDIIEQALSGFVNVLSFVSIQGSKLARLEWVLKCFEHVKAGRWILQSLRLIRDIVASTPVSNRLIREGQISDRERILQGLVHNHLIIQVVTKSLQQYLAWVKTQIPADSATVCRLTFKPDGQHLHSDHIGKRLEFIKFVVGEGNMYLDVLQAQEVWSCLMIEPPFPEDSELCLVWFAQDLLMPHSPDLTRENASDFMVEHLFRQDPAGISELGFRCFERFFRLSNALGVPSSGLSALAAGRELIGWDYLWELLLKGNDRVADLSISLLKDTVTYSKGMTLARMIYVHDQFLEDCVSKLNVASKDLQDTVSAAGSEVAAVNGERSLVLSVNGSFPALRSHVRHCVRIINLLREFATKCDVQFCRERHQLPHCKASRGENLVVVVRFLQGPLIGHEERYSLHQYCTIGHLRSCLQHSLAQLSLSWEPLLRVNREELPRSYDHRLLECIGQRENLLVGAVNPVRDVNADAAAMDSPVSSGSENSEDSGSRLSSSCRRISEDTLPSVILSRKGLFVTMLLSLLDVATMNGFTELSHSCFSLLQAIPTDPARKSQFLLCLRDESESTDVERGQWTDGVSSVLRSCFVDASPAKALYNLEVLQSLVMPNAPGHPDEALSCQEYFVRAGGLGCMVALLRGEGFFQKSTCLLKQSAQRVVFRLCKLLFAAVAQARVHSLLTSLQEGLLSKTGQFNAELDLRSPAAQRLVKESAVCQAEYETACRLQNVLLSIPRPSLDGWLHSCALFIGGNCPEVLATFTPDHLLMESARAMAWRACACKARDSTENLPAKVHAAMEEFSTSAIEDDLEDVDAARDGLEVLALLSGLLPVVADYQITHDPEWSQFIMDILLRAREAETRESAVRTIFILLTVSLDGKGTAAFILGKLIDLLPDLPTQSAYTYTQFFVLVCRLLNHGGEKVCGGRLKEYISAAVSWLDHARVVTRSGMSASICETMLTGYLNVVKCLVHILPPAEKEALGTGDGCCLIKKLLEDFLFPFSSQQEEKADTRREGRSTKEGLTQPVCRTGPTQPAAFEVLVELCSQCLPNVDYVCKTITTLFYTGLDVSSLNEWEYQPNVAAKEQDGFVGLRNAGATCYMNAVLQTLFMIPPIRNTILSAHNAGWSEVDDGLTRAAEEPSVGSTCVLLHNLDLASSPSVPAALPEHNSTDGGGDVVAATPMSHEESPTPYSVTLLRHIQHVFGQLLGSNKLYCSPVGFWRTFKLHGEHVEVRDQFDALEFMSNLTDSIDQALHQLGHAKAFEEALGGAYADQKNCKTCPHRYSRKEQFTSVAVDIRNCNSLEESLAEYVKGDLLEGVNMYHCEKCDEKVEAVKRLCFDQLPKVLAIQLKRFHYDWEKECAVKFNDYFEFPRELDMYPYTVEGLADAEGEEAMDCSSQNGDSSTQYSLCGVIVHHGQASTGHYYAFIKQRCSDGTDRWSRFDDTDVTECEMSDNDMKNVFFGGFGNEAGVNGYRRQKRWYSAYLLFYERQDLATFSSSIPVPELPQHVVKAVRQGNLTLARQRAHFCPEYFAFMKDLLITTLPITDTPITAEQDQHMLIVCKLVSTFLFAIGLRCRFQLRGQGDLWLLKLSRMLYLSRACREWFVKEILLRHMDVLSEFLSECPQADVRYYFAQLLGTLCHACFSDGRVEMPKPSKGTSLAGLALYDGFSSKHTGKQHVVLYVTQILELVSVRVLSPYPNAIPIGHFCQFYVTYASYGPLQITHLRDLGVDRHLVSLMLKDPRFASGSDVANVYGLIVRMLSGYHLPPDQLERSGGSGPKNAIDPADNPYLSDISTKPTLAPSFFVNAFTSERFWDRLLGEIPPSNPDLCLLVLRLMWEAPTVSHSVLIVLVAFAHQPGRGTGKNRPAFLDLLANILNMDDSWQDARTSVVVIGNDQRDGLLGLFKKARMLQSDRRRQMRLAKCNVHILQRCERARKFVFEIESRRNMFKLLTAYLCDEFRPSKKPVGASDASRHTEPTGDELAMVAFCEATLAALSPATKAACKSANGDVAEGEESPSSVKTSDKKEKRPNSGSFDGGSAAKQQKVARDEVVSSCATTTIHPLPLPDGFNSPPTSSPTSSKAHTSD